MMDQVKNLIPTTLTSVVMSNDSTELWLEVWWCKVLNMPYETVHYNLQEHSSLTPIYLYIHTVTVNRMSSKTHPHYFDFTSDVE